MKRSTHVPILPTQEIAQLLKEHPIDIRSFNFFDKKALESRSWSRDTLDSLRALQRISRLLPVSRARRQEEDSSLDVQQGIALALLGRGLTSAHQIAAMPASKFVARYADCFPLTARSSSKSQAKKLYKKALAVTSKTVLDYVAIVQHTGAHYRKMRASNLASITDEAYGDLPSYEELFGGLDFCTCKECRSIFSPAAYLVDLMRLVDDQIDQEGEDLLARRPDLPSLVLSCDNTNNLVSKLTIVNKLLLNHVPGEGSEGEKYQALVTTKYPFNLPFHLPLEKIRTYLKGHQTSLARLWDELTLPSQVGDLQPYLEELGLTSQEWTLYSTIQTGSELPPLYGLTTLAGLEQVDTFMQQTGLDYEQLTKLLYQDLSEEEIQAQVNKKFFINTDTYTLEIVEEVETIEEVETVVNYIKQKPVAGGEALPCTAGDFDKLHRFIRLAHAVGWTFSELDLALQAASALAIAGERLISDALLPYLAWVKTLQEAGQLTIYQACGFLNLVKDYGRKNGPTFFDQIFNAPTVPSPPAWPDDTLIWNVPGVGEEPATPQDKQIQNALAAALKLASEDLLAIAREMPDDLVEGDGDKLVQITLSLENLSLLYRCSLLARLTGFSIQECQVAYGLMVYPVVHEGASGYSLLYDLVRAADGGYQIITALTKTLQKIQATGLSIYYLEYWITGKTTNKAIVNQILAGNALENALTALSEAIKATLLAEDKYLVQASSILAEAENRDELAQKAWGEIKTNYCPDGIITVLPASTDEVEEILSLAVPTETPGFSQLVEVTYKILVYYWDLQHQTLYKHLASLYGIDAQLMPLLTEWAGLSLTAVMVKAKEMGGEGKSQSRAWAFVPDVVTGQLQTLQCYASFIKKLRLSLEEVETIYANPQYFDIHLPSTDSSAKPWFIVTLANIELIYQFKYLVQSLQDNQNKLLTYPLYAETVSQVEGAAALASIMGWEVAALTWLLDKLWPEANTGTPKPWSRMANILALQPYFSLAAKLQLDVASVYELKELPTLLSSSEEYAQIDALAGKVGASLQARYGSDPTPFQQASYTLSNAQRDALLPLVIDLLQEAEKPVASARDLSEYLLTDVEVDGIVETSLIVEATSAVQLYIYRCLNNLEANVTLNPNLPTWWEWMANYRVWQANREVFLYPENYIQPALRNDKSPEFMALDDELKQANLTDPDAATPAFHHYIEGFAAVANLEIVGSALYDHRTVDEEGDVADEQKVLCLIGKTRQDPYTYSYRTAVWTPAEVGEGDGKYLPAQWNPWYSLGLQITPLGPVTPVYAFGKWHIFWVEQIQSGGTESGGTVTKEYTAQVKFSHLNFSGQWVVPRQLASVVLDTSLTMTVKDITQLTDATEKSYWDRVYPVFFSSIQSLQIPYGNPQYRYSLQEDAIGEDMSLALRYVTKEKLTQGIAPLDAEFTDENMRYEYASTFGNKTIPESDDYAVSLWFKLDTLPAEGTTTPLIGNHVTIDASGQLLIEEFSTPIQLGSWNQLVLSPQDQDQDEGQYQPVTSFQAPSLTVLDENLYIAWLGADQTISYGQLDGNKQVINTQTLVELIRANAIPSLSVCNNQLHMAWIEKEGDKFYISYGQLDKNEVINKATVEQIADCNPSLTVWKDQLYMAWTARNSAGWEKIYYGKLTKDQVEGEVELQAFSYYEYKYNYNLAVCNNQLYIVYLENVEAGSDPNTCHGPLSGNQVTKRDVLTVQTSFIYSSTAVWKDENGKEQVWIAWKKDSDEIAYGCLNVSEIKHEKTLSGVASSYSPSLAVWNNQLYIAWTDKNSENSDKISYGWLNEDKVMEPNELVQQVINHGTSIYVNGEPVGSVNKIDFDTSLPLGTNGTTTFMGSMQEVVCWPHVLTASDVASLYANREASITQDFEVVIPAAAPPAASPAGNAFTAAVSSLPVLSQPNSYVVSYQEATFIGWPYLAIIDAGTIAISIPYLSCTRLNTTAIKALSQRLLMYGVDYLLAIPSQRLDEIPFAKLGPNTTYIPEATWPSDKMDFMVSAMSGYYWELFFHTPFLIAYQLQTQQRFDAAKQWYEYIFNPAVQASEVYLEEGGDPSDKYWGFVGLRSGYNPVLADDHGKSWAEGVQEDTSNTQQLYQYHYNPFDPHAIARLRPIAYQKTVLMQYVASLMAWGDMLYRQYTTESLVEAYMLYMMAYDLLGKKPLNLGECPLPADETLEVILAAAEAGGNEFIILLEQAQGSLIPSFSLDSPVNYIPNAYFGLPENEQFNGYWDLVESRLYNMRHSLTIDGIFQQTPLFSPSLDPMQLVQQVGSGASLSEVTSGFPPPIPYYRYRVCLERAKEATNLVIQLGSSLLSVLEKKDAEGLARLYSVNQQNLVSLTRTSKENVLKEVQQSMASLEESKRSAAYRKDYYGELVSKGWLEGEIAQISLEGIAIGLQVAAQVTKIPAVISYLLPNVFGLSCGGMEFGDAAALIPSSLEGSAQATSMSAGLSANVSAYQRREEDWKLQEVLASYDLSQLDSQLLGIQYQEVVAEQELVLLEKTVEEEQKVEQYLLGKFTSEALYQWYIGRVSGLYFQAYQLALSLAQTAERAFYFEKGLPTGIIIQGSYWDSLHQGLLAGETLMLDLLRMDQAYMQQGKRVLEIQKTISLAQLNPHALMELKNKGTCTFEFTEKDFDLDYPGHYVRQVKNIGVSFPALLAPYQNIHATLTQTSNRTLVKPDLNGVQYLLDPAGGDEKSIQTNLMTNQQIALSQGVNDAGLFVLDFNDDQYLPFEGTGAIATWQLDVPLEENYIDYNSLTDVIIQLNYTASAGDNTFKKGVKDLLKGQSFSLYNMTNLAQAYATSWHLFLSEGEPLVWKIEQSQLQRGFSSYTLAGIYLQLILTEKGKEEIGEEEMITMNLAASVLNGGSKALQLVKGNSYAASLSQTDFAADAPWIDEDWTLSATESALLNPENIENMVMIVSYQGIR